MKKLVIVESPAKAKTIAQYLGSDFLVKASYGHVRDLPPSKLGIDVDNHFAVDYQTIARAKKNVADLRKTLKESSELYLATDPDREGEAIAWHLVKELKPKTPVHRIAFTEITKTAVQDAIKHPREVDQDLVDAQQARRILDRLVGYKLSPLLWKKVYRGLSAGRVQSVAVRLVVEREREIKAFQTKETWTLEATIKAKNGVFPAYVVGKGSASKSEFSNKEEAEKLIKQLNNSDLLIEDIAISESQLRPQAPLITSTLQQMAARLHGFSAKRTMKLAQDLYEGIEVAGHGTKGLITYMRTDSYNIASIARGQAESVVASTYGPSYLPDKPNVFSKKVRGAQEAHEAIRPTDFTITPEEAAKSLSNDHAKLYTLIYRATISSMMTPARVKNTVVTIEGSKGVRLLGRGRSLEFDGFLKVFPDSEERFEALPTLEKSEKVTVKKIEPIQHFTEPPARYSEASLVKELEKRGIGRPSTYAPIMSTIVDRGYVTKQNSRFIPESVAEVVTDLLVENFPNIVDYNFTADMEDSLDDIAEGKKELEPVLEEFYTPFAKLLSEKENTIDKKALVEEATDQVCPKCAKPLIIKLGRYGKFYACTGYPACDYKAPILDESISNEEKKQIEEITGEKCPDCGGDLTLKQSRFGKFIGCANYPKCKYTKSIEVKAEASCPNCGGALVRKNTRRGRSFWGCANYPKCKTAFWDEPSSQKCPKCQNILLKKKTGLACSQCDYSEAKATK